MKSDASNAAMVSTGDLSRLEDNFEADSDGPSCHLL